MKQNKTKLFRNIIFICFIFALTVLIFITHTIFAQTDTNYTMSHSVIISGLSPGTTYHYQVKSKDAAGNIASSGDLTFTTLPATTSIVTSPQGSGGLLSGPTPSIVNGGSTTPVITINPSPVPTPTPTITPPPIASSVNINNPTGNNLSISYNLGAVTLRSGSKGAAVMELQRFLNRFLNLGLVIDGKLGPKTIVVIKKWQLGHGLVADGLIGPKTRAMINAEAANN